MPDPADGQIDPGTGLTFEEREQAGRDMAVMVSHAVARRFATRMKAAALPSASERYADDVDILAMTHVQPAALDVLTVFFTSHSDQLGALDDYLALEDELRGS